MYENCGFLSLAYAGNFGGLAYPRCREHFANFPRKNRRVFPFALDDRGDDARGEKPRSAPSDGLWLQESRAAVAAQDLADAAVGHLKRAAVSLDCGHVLRRKA